MALNSMNNDASLNLLSIRKLIIEFIAILLVINVNNIGLVIGHSEHHQQHHNNRICEHRHPKAHDVSFICNINERKKFSILKVFFFLICLSA